MNILFVTHSLKIGGATKQLILLANALVRYGHNISVYTYSFNRQPASLLAPQVNYICEKNILENAKLEYFITPSRIRRIVRLTHADTVIGWRTNAGCLVALGCLGLKVNTVFCERSDPYMEDNFMLHIAKWFCNLNDYGVFQTTGARDYYKFLKKSSVVIPNPYSFCKENVEPKSYHGRKNEIACVGRFELIQKRQDVMLEAFKLFYTKHPEFKLSFYGDGQDLQKIKNMAESMGISDSVIFHGSVTNVINKIADSKLLVLSSDYEGIPNVILEAFMVGTPVVSTDCSPGGAKLLINSGENGFVVPIRDPKALADAMSNVIINDSLSISFIKNGKKKLEEFAPNVIFDKWNNYLSGL